MQMHETPTYGHIPVSLRKC